MFLIERQTLDKKPYTMLVPRFGTIKTRREKLQLVYILLSMILKHIYQYIYNKKYMDIYIYI